LKNSAALPFGVSTATTWLNLRTMGGSASDGGAAPNATIKAATSKRGCMHVPRDDPARRA
jgi:hypothetical protein